MAKGIDARLKKPWVEVAPSLIDLPWKSSVCPRLETIVEDRDEEKRGEEDDDNEEERMMEAAECRVPSSCSC